MPKPGFLLQCYLVILLDNDLNISVMDGVTSSVHLPDHGPSQYMLKHL
jgi:hypothetical protein